MLQKATPAKKPMNVRLRSLLVPVAVMLLGRAAVTGAATLPGGNSRVIVEGRKGGERIAGRRLTIGIAGDRFTINHVPTFLLGISYFDARNWHQSDIEELGKLGYNSVRIWIDWADRGFFNRNGDWIAKAKLLNLVCAANARGMVVDVTILNSHPSASDSFGVRNREKVVRKTVTALKNSGNVFFDVMNEHDHGGTPATHDDIKHWIRVARQADKRAIVTVSSTDQHLLDASGSVQSGNVNAELDAGAMILTPHLQRTADWDAQTGSRVRLLKTYLRRAGRDIPVYLQEESRRGYQHSDPTEEQFLRAARAASDARAAGFNFHTGAGFDLRTHTLFDRLDPVERKVIAELPGVVFRRSYRPN